MTVPQNEPAILNGVRRSGQSVRIRPLGCVPAVYCGTAVAVPYICACKSLDIYDILTFVIIPIFLREDENIMAKNKGNDKKVEQITDMEVDFTQWFTDVCKKAQLIDYSSIKGVFIYRPYGYAIWENIQSIMDKEFKKQGVENVYMPMLIPESLLQKEKDHVEGFAPECAWVTMGGGEELEEKFAIRPTSSPRRLRTSPRPC